MVAYSSLLSAKRSSTCIALPRTSRVSSGLPTSANKAALVPGLRMPAWAMAKMAAWRTSGVLSASACMMRRSSSICRALIAVSRGFLSFLLS
jgi:hypothetical protein